MTARPMAKELGPDGNPRQPPIAYSLVSNAVTRCGVQGAIPDKRKAIIGARSIATDIFPAGPRRHTGSNLVSPDSDAMTGQMVNIDGRPELYLTTF